METGYQDWSLKPPLVLQAYVFIMGEYDKQRKQTPWAESASELYRPPLWSSSQSSGFDSRRY
jgi:hypothetical protein